MQMPMQQGDTNRELTALINDLELADKSYHAGRFQEAVVVYQQAVEVLEQELGRLDPDYITCLQRLANCQCALEQYAKALSTYERLYFIGHEILGEHHPDVEAMSAKISELKNKARNKANRDRGLDDIDERASKLSQSSIKVLRPLDGLDGGPLHNHVEEDLQQLQQRLQARAPEKDPFVWPSAQELRDKAREKRSRTSGSAASENLARKLGYESAAHLQTAIGRISGYIAPAVVMIILLAGGGLMLANLSHFQPQVTAATENPLAKGTHKFATADDAIQIELATKDDALEARMKVVGHSEPMEMPLVLMGPNLFEVFQTTLSCLSKKDIWMEVVPEGLRSEEGVIYYASNAPERSVIKEVRAIANGGRLYFLGGTGFPQTDAFPQSFPYSNPWKGASFVSKFTMHRLQSEDGRAVLEAPADGDPDLLKSLLSYQSGRWLIEPIAVPGDVHSLTIIRDYENPKGQDFYVHGFDRNAKLIGSSSPGEVYLVAMRNGETLPTTQRLALPQSKSRVIRLCVATLPAGISLHVLHLLFPAIVLVAALICVVCSQLLRPAEEKVLGFTLGAGELVALILFLLGLLWGYFLVYAA